MGHKTNYLQMGDIEKRTLVNMNETSFESLSIFPK